MMESLCSYDSPVLSRVEQLLKGEEVYWFLVVFLSSSLRLFLLCLDKPKEKIKKYVLKDEVACY